MITEIPDFIKLSAERNKSAQILGERVSLVDRIGTVNVKVGDSWEGTLKVGSSKKAVLRSIKRYEQEIERIDKQTELFAPQYLETLELRQSQLAQMEEFVAEGILTPENVFPHQFELEEFKELPNNVPGLARGLAKLEAEKANPTQEGITLPVKEIILPAKELKVIDEVLVERKAITTVSEVVHVIYHQTETSPVREEFTIPQGAPFVEPAPRIVEEPREDINTGYTREEIKTALDQIGVEAVTVPEVEAPVTTPDVAAFEEDEEVDEETEVEESVDEAQSVELNGTELAARIPSLEGRLQRITSQNHHKYSAERVIKTKVAEAIALPENQKTDEQRQLIADMIKMEKYTTETAYQDVYTPEELHALVVELETLAHKRRPDFGGIENELLRIKSENSQGFVVGARKRADADKKNRLGMNWANLEMQARNASGLIRNAMSKSPERQAYLITIKDPEPRKITNLTAVYQYVADYNTFTIMGKRNQEASDANCESYRNNCGTVNEWFAEVQDVFAEIPENTPAHKLVRQLRDMVDSMNIRLNGKSSGERVLTGFDKYFEYDTPGALSLQYKINHTVEELKAKLASNEGLQFPLTEGEDIIPL